MSHPTHVPPVQAPQAVVVEAPAAPKLVRTKKFVKIAFARVGVPVLIGSAAAYVATRRSNSQDSLEETSSPVE